MGSTGGGAAGIRRALVWLCTTSASVDTAVTAVLGFVLGAVGRMAPGSGKCWPGPFPPCPNQHKRLFTVCALPCTSPIPQCSHGHTPVPGSPTTLNNSPPRAVTALLCGSSGRSHGVGANGLRGARVRLGAGQSGGGAKRGGRRRIRSTGGDGCARPKRSVRSGSVGRRVPRGLDARCWDAPYLRLRDAAPGTLRARPSGTRVAGCSASARRDARCGDARRPAARDALQRRTAAPGRSPLRDRTLPAQRGVGGRTPAPLSPRSSDPPRGDPPPLRPRRGRAPRGRPSRRYRGRGPGAAGRAEGSGGGGPAGAAKGRWRRAAGGGRGRAGRDGTDGPSAPQRGAMRREAAGR